MGEDYFKEINSEVADELRSLRLRNSTDCFLSHHHRQDGFTTLKMREPTCLGFILGSVFSNLCNIVLFGGKAEGLETGNKLLLELAFWLDCWLVAVRTHASSSSAEDVAKTN